MQLNENIFEVATKNGIVCHSGFFVLEIHDGFTNKT